MPTRDMLNFPGQFQYAHLHIHIHIYVKVDIGGKHLSKRSKKLGGFSATFATCVEIHHQLGGAALKVILIKMIQGPRTLFAKILQTI